MKLTRSICQYDYPATPTQAGKPANSSACVLAVMQMQIETITGETYLETDLYKKLTAARIIRDDCYINNYDDALRLVLFDRKEFVNQPETIERIKKSAMRWAFFHRINEMPPGEHRPVVPITGYMKAKQHAVAIVSFAVPEVGEVLCKVIDPKYRGEQARRVMPLSDFKRFGVFQ